MKRSELTFGYHPWPLKVSAGQLAIEPLPQIKETVAFVEANNRADGDWIYAPMQRTSHLGGCISERPYPSRIFGLPKTHVVKHEDPDNEDQLIFHLWTLSFFTGMRLTSTEAGFVDATPIKPGKLVDFVLPSQGLSDAMSVSETFWVSHRADRRRSLLVAAAIHALFLGQSPIALQFERFLLLYTAFDTCFALAKSLHQPRGHIIHAERVKWMCDLFGMTVPGWADPTEPSGPLVASLRNEGVHEALFVGAPLGFALHGVGTNQNMTLEMQALICRLIVALLGASGADYVRSPVNTRQCHGLKLG